MEKNKAPHESYDFKLPLPQGLVIWVQQQHHTHAMGGIEGNVESLDMEGSIMDSSFGGSYTNNVDGMSQVSDRVEQKLWTTVDKVAKRGIWGTPPQELSQQQPGPQ